MTATVYYDSTSEIATLGNTFMNSAGTPTDPTTVSCVVTDPSGAVVTHTYGGTAPADVTKIFAGVYSLPVICSPAVIGVDGLWSYVWVGTGAVVDVQPGTWRVLALDQSRWYVGPEELKDRLGIPDTTTDSVITQVVISSGSPTRAPTSPRTSGCCPPTTWCQSRP